MLGFAPIEVASAAASPSIDDDDGLLPSLFRSRLNSSGGGSSNFTSNASTMLGMRGCLTHGDNNNRNNNTNMQTSSTSSIVIVPHCPEDSDGSFVDFVDPSSQTIVCTFRLLPAEGRVSSVAMLRVRGSSVTNCSSSSTTTPSSSSSSPAQQQQQHHQFLAFVGTSRGWHILINLNGDVLWMERRVSVTKVAVCAAAPIPPPSSSSSSSCASFSSPALVVLHENGLCAVYLAEQFENAVQQHMESQASLSDHHQTRRAEGSTEGPANATSQKRRRRIYFAITIHDRRRIHQLPPDDPEMQAFYASHTSVYPKIVVNLGASIPSSSSSHNGGGGVQAGCCVSQYYQDPTLGALFRSNVLKISIWLAGSAFGVWATSILVDDSNAENDDEDDDDDLSNDDDEEHDNGYNYNETKVVSSSVPNKRRTRHHLESRGVAHRMADVAMSMLAQKVFHSKTLADALATHGSSTSIDSYPLVDFSCAVPSFSSSSSSSSSSAAVSTTSSSASVNVLPLALPPSLSASFSSEAVCAVHFVSEGRILVFANDVVVRTIRGVRDCVVVWLVAGPTTSPPSASYQHQQPRPLLGVFHRKRHVLEAYDAFTPLTSTTTSKRVAAVKIDGKNPGLSAFLPKQEDVGNNNNDTTTTTSPSTIANKAMEWAALPRSSMCDGSGGIIIAKWTEPTKESSSSPSSSSSSSSSKVVRMQWFDIMCLAPAVDQSSAEGSAAASTPGGKGGREQQQQHHPPQELQQLVPLLPLDASPKDIEHVVRLLVVAASNNKPRRLKLRDVVQRAVENASSDLLGLRTLIKTLSDRFVTLMSSTSSSSSSSASSPTNEEQQQRQYFEIMSKPECALARQVLIVLNGLVEDVRAAKSVVPFSSPSSTSFTTTTTTSKVFAETDGEKSDEQQQQHRERLKQLFVWSLGVVAGTQRGIGDPGMLAQQAASASSQQYQHQQHTATHDARSQGSLQLVRGGGGVLDRLRSELASTTTPTTTAVDVCCGEKKEDEGAPPATDRQQQQQDQQQSHHADPNALGSGGCCDGQWLLRTFSFSENIQLAVTDPHHLDQCCRDVALEEDEDDDDDGDGDFVGSSRSTIFLRDVVRLGQQLFGGIPFSDALKAIRHPSPAMSAAGIRTGEAAFALVAWLCFSTSTATASQQQQQQHNQQQHGGGCGGVKYGGRSVCDLFSLLESEVDFRRLVGIVASCPFPALKFLCLKSRVQQRKKRFLAQHHQQPEDAKQRNTTTAGTAHLVKWMCVLRLAQRLEVVSTTSAMIDPATVGPRGAAASSSSSSSSSSSAGGELDFLCTFIRTVDALEETLASLSSSSPTSGVDGLEKPSVDDNGENDADSAQHRSPFLLAFTVPMGQLSSFGGPMTAFTAFASSSSSSSSSVPSPPASEAKLITNDDHEQATKNDVFQRPLPHCSTDLSDQVQGWTSKLCRLSSVWTHHHQRSSEHAVLGSQQQQHQQHHHHLDAARSAGLPLTEVEAEVESKLRSVLQLCSLALALLEKWAPQHLEYDDPILVESYCSVTHLIDAVSRNFFAPLLESNNSAKHGGGDGEKSTRHFEFELLGALCLTASSAAVARAVFARFWPDVVLAQGPEVYLTRKRDGRRSRDSRPLLALLDVSDFAMESLQSHLVQFLIILQSEAASKAAEAMFLPDFRPLVSLTVARCVSSDASLPIPRIAAALVHELSAIAQAEDIAFLPLVAAERTTQHPHSSSPTISTASDADVTEGGGGGGGATTPPPHQNSRGHHHSPPTSSATTTVASSMLVEALSSSLDAAIRNVVQIDNHVNTSPAAVLRVVAALRVVLKHASIFRNYYHHARSATSRALLQQLSMSQLLLCEEPGAASDTTDDEEIGDGTDDKKEDDDVPSIDDLLLPKHSSRSSKAMSSSSAGDDDDTDFSTPPQSSQSSQSPPSPHLRVLSRICRALQMRHSGGEMHHSDYNALLEYDAAWRGGNIKSRANAEIMAQSAHYVWAHALAHALRCGQDDLALQDLIRRVNHKAVVAAVILAELRFRLAAIVDKLERASNARDNPAAQRAANDIAMSIPLDLKKWVTANNNNKKKQGDERSDPSSSSSSSSSNTISISKALLQRCATLAARVVELRASSAASSASDRAVVSRGRQLATTFQELLARYK